MSLLWSQQSETPRGMPSTSEPIPLMDKNDQLEALEVRLLLDAINEHYGFYFRDYAYASLRRRVLATVNNEGLHSISGLQERILHSESCFDRFLLQLTVNVTSMFRDPLFYRTLR